MPGGKTTKHITAAAITANAAEYNKVLQQMARGTDATARRMQRSWGRLTREVRDFDQAVARGMIHARRNVETQAKAMQRALQSVNFGAAGMTQARQARAAMPLMAKGGSMLRMAAGFATPFALYGLGERSRQFSGRITDVQIKAGMDTGWGQGLEKQVLRVSDAIGKSRDEVLDFVQQFTELTGKADMARKMLKEIGDVAVASNAPMADLAGVVEQLTGSLNITDPKALRQTMSVILQHERLGKVPFAALAGQLGKMTAQGQVFGKAGQGFEAARAMSGLFQITARGYGAGQEGMVATGGMRFLQNVARRREKIEKAFDIKLGTGEGDKFVWKPLAEVFKEIGRAVAQSPAKMAKMGIPLFGMMGVRAAQQLGGAYKQGWGTSVGSRTAAKEIFEASGAGVLEKSIADRQASISHRWDKAVTRMSNTMHRHMLPVLEKATELLPGVAKALKFFLEHSESIIKLWLGYKGAAFFAAMAGRRGMGAGGAMGLAGATPMGMGGTAMMLGPGGMAVQPGSDLHKLQMEKQNRMGARFKRWATGGRSMGSNVGRGALASLPMIPFAVDMGYKLGEWLAGRTMASVREAEKLSMETAVNTARLKIKREMKPLRMLTAKAELGDFFRSTQRGAILKRETTGALDKLLTMDESGRFTLPIGEITRKKGKKGLEGLRDQLGGYYEQMRAAAAQRLRSTGQEVTQANLEKALPILGILAKVLGQMEATLARLERGEGIRVDAKVTLPSPDGSPPGERSKNRVPQS